MALRIAYALCLLGATFTHVQTVWTYGLFWDYQGAPLVSRIFWTALTFLDPLAVVLIFLKPRVGLGLMAAIIFTDVVHNTWTLSRDGSYEWSNWMYLSQVAFLLFVSSSIRFAWPATTPGGSPIDPST